jgi:Holliday junction resolvasome RuvABC DNA-binding subunit
MWAAFLTGAATKATSLIEERDKEIQDDITLKINEMYKSAQETKKKAETRADKLREFASQLKALGFSDDEAVAVISSGEANTENVINLATEKAKVSPVTARGAYWFTAGWC